MTETNEAAKKQSGRQRGNMLLGIIVGLVFGLGIAVIVALMISKSSTPLSNKQGKTEKVVETAPSQVVDPNKPLYGKQDPAKDAPKDPAKDATPTIVEIPTEQPKPATTAKATEPKPVAHEAKPAHDNGKAAADKPAKKPEAKAADNGKSAKSDDKWTYYLQAGAYRDRNDAESARAKLALLGYEARISDMSSQGSTLHRVRIGPFNQVEAMNKVRGKLSEGGVDAAVIRIPK